MTELLDCPIMDGHGIYGRPLSLGDEIDRLDAEALLSVLVAAKGVMQRHGVSGAQHLAREALWDIWERPRLPAPLVSSKYPMRYPWSPAARHLFKENDGRRPSGGWGLVLEHLTPRNLLLGALVDELAEQTPETLAEYLHRHLVAAVVTRGDDRLLAAAGVGSRAVADADPADLWARYRVAGLDPAGFVPLAGGDGDEAAPMPG